MNVAKRMKRNPVFIDEGASMKCAMDLLKEHEIRHLPVLKGGERLVGILSERDIKQASPSPATALEIREIYYLLDKVTVKQIMTRRPYTVPSSTPIEDAAMIFREKKIGCLPVVDDGKLVGILTETDIIDAFIEVMGVGGPGNRIEIAVANRPGMLFEVMKLLKDFDVNILSMATSPSDDPGRKVFIFRIETGNFKMVKNAIRKAGFDLLSAD
jgi:acetoin utilization protein AcuB